MKGMFFFAVSLAWAQTPDVGVKPGPNPYTIPSSQARGALISGRFVMEDGSAPPALVRVELTCNSIARPQGWSDEQGYFSVRMEVNNPDEIMDLTYATTPQRPNSGALSTSEPPPIDTIPRNLEGCDVRGALGGYRSSVIPLSGHRRLDSPDIGTIVLYPVEKVQGFTTSATTDLAPAAAKKAHEKALEDLKKNKPDEAEKELKKAVQMYPRYALAWFDLGRIYESRDRTKEAAEAYRHSTEADDKYLPPYERLYILAAREENWALTRELAEKVIHLDPVDFPRAYYFDAIADLNLGDVDAAEKSAREAVRMDLHANPRAGYVLGVILARKQEFAEASALLDAYLKVAPAIEKDAVERQAAEARKHVAQK